MTLPVSVVLVTWNSADTLAVALDSLAASTPRPAELVVVDNASTDATPGLLESFAARGEIRTRILRNDANLGFAAAANRGIREAAEPFVFLLNPDLRLRPDTLTTLHASLDLAPPDVAAAGGKLYRGEGEGLRATNILDSTGIVMTRSGRHFDRGAGEADLEQYDSLGEVFGITGAAVLFRKEALFASQVDGEIFDEDFFAYREDADLAWRLRGFGYRALYDPDAVAFHRRRVTPERRGQLPETINAHSVKNRFLLRIHHADLGWLLRFGPSAFLRDLVVVGACLTVERSSLPALLSVVRLLPKHWRRRREILRRRRVPSAALRGWFA